MSYFYNTLIIFSLIVISPALSAQPEWVQSLDFPGEARNSAVSFSINGKGFLGLGVNEASSFADFWQYNPETGKWTQVADYQGLGRENAVAFVIEGKAYVGLGRSGTYPDFTYHNDFWCYDPSTDAWTELNAFAGSARYQSVAFHLNGKGMVMFGANSSGYPTDVWAYDPGSGNWTEKNNFPDQGRTGAFVFNLNETVYVGHGVNYEGGSTNLQNNYHVYNQETDSWKEVDILPSKITIRNNIFYFSLEGKGYFGGGINGNETWQFNPADNSWTLMDVLGSYAYNLSSSTAFVIDNIVHLATGYHSTGTFEGHPVNDFFKFGKELTVPESPSEVIIKMADTTSVLIYWKDESNNESGFVLERSKGNSSNFETIADLPPNTTSFIDETLTEYDYYYYRISSYNDGYDPGPNKSFYYAFPYQAPTDLKIYDNAARNVKITWNDNAYLEDGFIIERSLNDSLHWEIIDTVEAYSSDYENIIADNKVEYIDKTLAAQTIAYYKVKAYSGTEVTSYTNTEQAYLDEIGNWQKISEFPGGYRSFFADFVIGNKLYFGTGNTSNQKLKDFWEFNLDDHSWHQLQDFSGPARSSAVTYVIDGKAYMGTGYGTDATLKDFWMYDPATDTWTQKADFPGTANASGAGFVIENNAYLLPGLDSKNNRTKDFYQYDPANDQWLQKAQFPGSGRGQGIAVAANGMGYVGLGISFIIGDLHNDFYVYDHTLNSWEKKEDVPGSYKHWSKATIMAAGDFIYAGTGVVYQSYIGNDTNKLWKYQISQDQWVPWGTFPVVGESKYGFSYQGELYILTNNHSENTIEIYQHRKDAPAAPDEFLVTADTEKAYLQWTDRTDKETGYVLERKTDEEEYQIIANLDPDLEDFTDMLPVDRGLRFEYRLLAVNNSDSSEVVTAYTYRTPQNPENLQITQVSHNSMGLAWQNKSQLEHYHQIYLSIQDTLNYQTYDQYVTDNTYTLYDLKENTTYYFKLRAKIGDALSSFEKVSGRTYLNRPQMSSWVLSAQGMEISWEDLSDHENGYQVERSYDNQVFEMIYTSGSGETVFTDQDYVEGIAYYRVKAFNDDNESEYSNVVAVETYLMPSDLTATEVSPTSVKLSWKNHSQLAESVFLRRETVSSSFIFTNEMNPDTETETEDGLEESTLYHYSVSVYNDDDTAEFIPVRTTIYAPSDLMVQEEQENRVKLSWQNNTATTDYLIIVEMAQAGSEFTAIDTLISDVSTYWVENLEEEINYEFRIKIFNQYVASHYSEPVYYSIIPTALTDPAENKLMLFPNPTHDKIIISTDKPVTDLQILDLQGNLVVHLLPEPNNIYDLSHLSRGVYLIRVTIDQQINVLKFTRL